MYFVIIRLLVCYRKIKKLFFDPYSDRETSIFDSISQDSIPCGAGQEKGFYLMGTLSVCKSIFHEIMGSLLIYKENNQLKIIFKRNIFGCK